VIHGTPFLKQLNKLRHRCVEVKVLKRKDITAAKYKAVSDSLKLDSYSAGGFVDNSAGVNS